MIITRTPFRISFVGGGTDLRSFYSKHKGAVLSAAIDKYLYVVVKRQIGVVESKYRIVWNQIEKKDTIDTIDNPIAREALRLLKIDFPVEITTFSDIPSSTGLGSSSAFSVGLIHALFALKREYITKYQLAKIASDLEVDILGRTMGKQDQYASSYGGVNVFTFNADETVGVDPVFLNKSTISSLEKNLSLFYTQVKRDASEVLKDQNEKTQVNINTLKEMASQAITLRDIFTSGQSLTRVGNVLHDAWCLKKTLSDSITSSEIDRIYRIAQDSGVIGGKLLGAGSGGFLIFYSEGDVQKRLFSTLSEMPFLKFKFDFSGSRITYYDQNAL